MKHGEAAAKKKLIPGHQHRSETGCTPRLIRSLTRTLAGRETPTAGTLIAVGIRLVRIGYVVLGNLVPQDQLLPHHPRFSVHEFQLDIRLPGMALDQLR